MDSKNGKATADINEDKLEETLKEKFFWAENPDINGLPDSFKKYFNDDNIEKKQLSKTQFPQSTRLKLSDYLAINRISKAVFLYL